MDNLVLKNNAGEEFKFFLDEDNNVCLNLNFKNELLGTIILCKEDLNGIKIFIDENYKHADE